MHLTDTSPTSLFFQFSHEGEYYEVEYSRKGQWRPVCLLRKETSRYWIQLSLNTVSFDLLTIILKKQKELQDANKINK